MQKAITAEMVNSVQPQSKPFEIRDTKLKGLLLRVQPSGCLTYYVEYERGKRMRVGRADTFSPAEARKEAKVILGDAFRGDDPSKAKRQRKQLTLEAFIDEVYQPWAKANIRTHEKTVERLKRSFKLFLKKRLSDITAHSLEKWRNKRFEEGLMRSTINREVDDIKSCVRKAFKWGYLEEFVLSDVKKWKIDDRAAVRYLDEEETQRLYETLEERNDKLKEARKSANKWRDIRGYERFPSMKRQAYADHLYPMVVLSLHTGLRQGEVFSLTWADVNLNAKRVTVKEQNAKSFRTRHVPLNARAMDAMEKWKKQSSETSATDLVFPGKNGQKLDNVNSAWRTLLKEANIKKFRWHDMRHNFASQLAMAGIDLNTVRELLGHADYQMTLRYAHLAPEHKADAVAVLE
ncbi:MAG: site-specific integrase [Methylocystaceae bacterium]|nr:site-specific integrase [Methylocystaceae bacterium]